MISGESPKWGIGVISPSQSAIISLRIIRLNMIPTTKLGPCHIPRLGAIDSLSYRLF
jgi:hypothetical protein